MKYDILHELREHLRGKYGANTADKYYFSVKALFKGLDFSSPEEIPLEEIENRMSRLKTKNDYSAAKCGLKEMQECFPSLPLPGEDFFVQGSQRKRNFKKRKFEPVNLDTIKRKINGLRDRKLKIAYRLMLSSGARVSELAALKPENIDINGSDITIRIEDGKGGKSRVINGINDQYLEKHLPELMQQAGTGNRIFYGADYLIHEAGAHGFECHDLRRAFSKVYLIKARAEAPDAFTANGQLMAAMGHSKWRTTKLYLKRKIQIVR